MHEDMTIEDRIKQAAMQIKKADKLIILAGAGMSADSGLSTFRDEDGYWKAQSINQFTLASYTTFCNDPLSSWKFYANRIKLYRATAPHGGYQILKKWCDQLGTGNSFVFTSNTDQHFEKSGFDRNQIYECHGSLGYMYCSDTSCSTRNAGLIVITEHQLTKIFMGCLPECTCGQLLRPHVLMFGDRSFNHDMNVVASHRWKSFSESIVSSDNLVVIEIGVGSTVTTVEDMTWQLSHKVHTVIQINPKKPSPDDSSCKWLSIDMSALVALILLENDVLNISEDYL